MGSCGIMSNLKLWRKRQQRSSRPIAGENCTVALCNCTFLVCNDQVKQILKVYPLQVSKRTCPVATY